MTIFKDDPDFRKHNQTAFGGAADELRSFVEHVERLEAEKKDIAEQIKEAMAEARGRGYDTKALKQVIAIRKKGADQHAEEEAVLDIYLSELGMR